MRVLITGGAGYIGAHVVRLLRDAGAHAVVVDDLSAGTLNRILGTPIVRIDIASDSAVDQLVAVMREHSIDAVIHLAAQKDAGESVQRPAWYYRQNIGGLASVLEAMEIAGVARLVFSSSAAVYGTAEEPIREDASTTPSNPYGESKLVGEWLIRAATKTSQLQAISLRYFNVAGAGWPELGDKLATNLIPIVFDAVDKGIEPKIYGSDYPTPDGTCVRDFVHVLDLAEAHVVSLEHLSGSNRSGHRVYNVGSGIGFSVREVIETVADAVGKPVPVAVVGRRAGDPAAVVAAVDRIRDELGWTARRDMKEMVRSGWEAYRWLSEATPDLPG